MPPPNSNPSGSPKLIARNLALSLNSLKLLERIQALKRAMNISGLVDQHGSVSTDEQRKLGLARPSFFDEINGAEAPLRLLKITESGTTGMYGAFEGAKSKMFLALISVGYTVKGSGSGGSYGYGKAGLIAGSSTRTVYAYSCFAPQEDDVVDGKPVTRRFLGMSYWGQHSNGSGSFTGFARFGDDEGEGVIPLVNEAADEMAERLGITNRDPANSSDFGTTFLLVDPVVERRTSTTRLNETGGRNGGRSLHPIRDPDSC